MTLILKIDVTVYVAVTVISFISYRQLLNTLVFVLIPPQRKLVMKISVCGTQDRLHRFPRTKVSRCFMLFMFNKYGLIDRKICCKLIPPQDGVVSTEYWINEIVTLVSQKGTITSAVCVKPQTFKSDNNELFCRHHSSPNKQIFSKRGLFCPSPWANGLFGGLNRR